MQFADIDAGRAIDARIDPADGRGGEVKPDAARHREPQMKERADEKIQKQHRPPAVAIDQEAAGRIAEDGGQRLHQLEGDGLGQRNAALLQDGRQHEQDAVRRPQKAERDDPEQERVLGAARRQQLEHRDLGLPPTSGGSFGIALISSAVSVRPIADLLDVGDGLFGFGNPAFAEQKAHRFRHVAAHEEQQQRRHDADREKRAPAQIRNDQQGSATRRQRDRRERRP